MAKGFSNALFGGASGLSQALPSTASLYTPPSGGPGFYFSSVGNVADFGNECPGPLNPTCTVTGQNTTGTPTPSSALTPPGPYTLTIPVGVQSVSDVYTQLQDYSATDPGSSTTSVEFEFSATQNGMNGTDTGLDASTFFIYGTLDPWPADSRGHRLYDGNVSQHGNCAADHNLHCRPILG